jgi:hypothetical protein
MIDSLKNIPPKKTQRKNIDLQFSTSMEILSEREHIII